MGLAAGTGTGTVAETGVVGKESGRQQDVISVGRPVDDFHGRGDGFAGLTSGDAYGKGRKGEGGNGDDDGDNGKMEDVGGVLGIIHRVFGRPERRKGWVERRREVEKEELEEKGYGGVILGEVREVLGRDRETGEKIVESRESDAGKDGRTGPGGAGGAGGRKL